MMEVHDCFSITELVTMEDLFISPEGGAVKDVMDGFYDADGLVPCQIEGLDIRQFRMDPGSSPG